MYFPERKTHKHKQIRGIVPGLGGWQKAYLCVCFQYGEKEQVNKPPPPNPGTIPLKFCLCVLLGQKSGRTKVSRIFRIFVPNFAPNFAPNFPRIFRGLFVLRFAGDGDQKKFTKNPRRFSMQNSQANTKKIFTKFFWGVAGKVSFAREVASVSLKRAFSTLKDAKVAVPPTLY